MNSIFHGSRLKIERANKHIGDLKTLMDGLVNTDSNRLSIKEDAETGKQFLKIDFIKPLPSETVLIIGDAIHNLHSALDLMMYAVVPNPDKHTKFPFRDDRQELVNAINGGKIKAAWPTEICDLIIDTIKPYPGGNDTLCGLHDLDIVDKHRRLILYRTVTAIALDIEDENGKLSVDLLARIGPDGLINAGFGNRKLHIENYRNPTFEIFFHKGEVFEGKSVLPTLHQLAQFVSHIVSIFERHIA